MTVGARHSVSRPCRCALLNGDQGDRVSRRGVDAYDVRVSRSHAPHRVIRGLVVACVGASIAVAGHGAASGGAPELTPILFLVVALTTAGAVVASARRWTLGRLVVALATMSVAIHLTLWLGAGQGAIDPRLAPLATTGHSHGHGHGTWSWPMLGAHLAAVVISALLLARVDSAVAVLVELARRLVIPRAGSAVPATIVWPYMSLVAPLRLELRALTAHSRRGPPGVLASS